MTMIIDCHGHAIGANIVSPRTRTPTRGARKGRSRFAKTDEGDDWCHSRACAARRRTRPIRLHRR